jgi:peptidoglycan-N-acetylglucosamine deacetylase
MQLFVRASLFVLAFLLVLVGCSEIEATPAPVPRSNPPKNISQVRLLYLALLKSKQRSNRQLQSNRPLLVPKVEVLLNHHVPLQPGLKEKERVKQAQVPVVVFQGPRSSKKVALTFDDGPDRNYTNQILDILKREHVPATFFVVGRMAQAYPDVLRRIDQEGHIIGNHSWNHPQFTKLSKVKIDFQIKHTNEIIQRVIAKEPMLVRPPYGSIQQELAKELNQRGFKIINWSVDTLDWKKKRPDAILGTVKRQIRPGGIILQHSAGGPQLRSTVEALPDMIAFLKQNHYQFVTVDELLGVLPYKETP